MPVVPPPLPAVPYPVLSLKSAASNVDMTMKNAAVDVLHAVLVSALTLPVPAVTILVEVQDSVVLAGNLI